MNGSQDRDYRYYDQEGIERRDRKRFWNAVGWLAVWFFIVTPLLLWLIA